MNSTRPEARRPALAVWHAELAAQFAARRCSERGCDKPVIVVSVGTEAVRAPGGFAVTRNVPDRNYCLRHAPGLVGEKVA